MEIVFRMSNKFSCNNWFCLKISTSSSARMRKNDSRCKFDIPLRERSWFVQRTLEDKKIINSQKISCSDRKTYFMCSFWRFWELYFLICKFSVEIHFRIEPQTRLILAIQLWIKINGVILWGRRRRKNWNTDNVSVEKKILNP